VPRILQKRRLYVVPHVHPFASCIRPSTAQQGSVVTLRCRFSSRARLGYLLDHVVMGRPLLPAAATLELAAATAACLTQDSAHESGELLSISSMAISAPIILPAATDDSAGFELVCSLDVATGQLSIGCVQAAGFEPVTCATATASLVKAEPTTGASQQGAQPQAAAVRSVLGGVIRQGIAAASAGSAAAAAPAAAANPVGTIAPVMGDWAASGYFSAPQQVDSALHLGVVNPGSGAKVPVAVSSFLLPVASTRTAGTGPLHASTSTSSSGTASASGLSSSSFLLSDAAGEAAAAAAGRVAGQASALGARTGGLVALVEDLRTKVVDRADLLKTRTQRQAAASPAAAGADSKQASTGGAVDAEDAEEVYPCSYETTWQVKEAAAAAAAATDAQLDSRHAGKLSLVVHDTLAPTRHTASEHLVLQLKPQASNGSSSAAAAAASTLAVLQQVNAVQQAHAAAGSGQQLSIHAGLSLAGSALGPAEGLQGLTGAADASSSAGGLLRTEATEQPALIVSLQAVDSLAAPQHSHAVSGSPGSLAATAVTGGALGVPRMLPCAKPEGAEFFTIRPEPRSALSNLVARAADISQVGCCCRALRCMRPATDFVFTSGCCRVVRSRLSIKPLWLTEDCVC
jgi:hypothetical protein